MLNIQYSRFKLKVLVLFELAIRPVVLQRINVGLSLNIPTQIE